MNFASDNVAGASPRVMEALVAANAGSQRAYGADDYTARVETRLKEIFERDLSVFLVATGTAANALALATLCPPWGAVLCHAEAHVAEDECGAPEFFTGGAKLVGFPGRLGKLLREEIAAYLATPTGRPPHQVVPSALSLTQATEAGTVYTPEEIAALADIAHRHGLGVHMDGARFANALVRLGVSPADMTWRAGVDVLSFGATKNGCLAAEAVIVFNPEKAAHMAQRRKRSGHLLSKGRLLGAQLDAHLADGHWLDLAARANRAADRLAEGLARLGCRVALPVEANEIFVFLPRAMDETLRAAGALYHPWVTSSLPEGVTAREGEVLVRLVTAFDTTEAAVDRFLAVAGGQKAA